MLILPDDFVKPRYNAACFADLPATIVHLLTGEGQPPLSPHILAGLAPRYETVIFLFIDAFGWRFVEEHRERYPFLQRLSQEGRLTQLTAQFPSTTAAHVTCIHTGLAAGQSGVYEWNYYEPQVDAVISPLLFSFAGDSKRDTLQPTGIDPRRLYPTRTLYHTLRQQEIDAYIFQRHTYARSTYSKIVFDGAEVNSYRTLSEVLFNLTDRVIRQEKPAYFFFYFDQIDGIAHRYGPQSPQLAAEIDTFLTAMERLFWGALAGRLNNTLLMMTADHGQVEVDPQTTIYLNTDPQFGGLQRFLQTDRSGEALVPGGSPRDVFLSIKEGYLDEAQAFLAERLAGRAVVYQTRDLIEQGFFGPTPPESPLLKRVGNLVILPFAGESVWWYEEDRFELKFLGHHGGLTRAEMEIPLFLYAF